MAKKVKGNPTARMLVAMSGQQNVVTVHRSFVDFTGSIECALMLSQLLYWSERATMYDDWFAKCDKELSEELSISIYAVRIARGKLEADGVIKTKVVKFAGTPQMHYRVDKDRLELLFSTWLVSPERLSTLRNRRVDFAKSKSGLCEIEESLTEITTETTAENKELLLQPAAEKTSQSETQPEQQEQGGKKRNKYQLWEKCTGTLSGMTAEYLDEMVQDWNEHAEGLPEEHPSKIDGEEVVCEAIETAEGAKRTPLISIDYVRAIINRWKAEGYKSKKAKPAQSDKPKYSPQPRNSPMGKAINQELAEGYDWSRPPKEEDGVDYAGV